jgi:hypothetical protein
MIAVDENIRSAFRQSIPIVRQVMIYCPFPNKSKADISIEDNNRLQNLKFISVSVDVFRFVQVRRKVPAFYIQFVTCLEF